jgi:hypothetical protein
MFNKSSRGPVSPTISWEIRGSINHIRSPSPNYTVGIRGRSTLERGNGPIHNPWIFKKTRPLSQMIRGSTIFVASLQHTKCGKATTGQSAFNRLLNQCSNVLKELHPGSDMYILWYITAIYIYVLHTSHIKSWYMRLF